MTEIMEQADHLKLDCGIELGMLPISGRPIVAMEIRLFCGYAYEDSECLGVTHVFEEAISKGTAKRDGRAFNDAFDEIGAAHSISTGRETLGFVCLCLPEYIDRAIELHAEMIRTPTLSEESCHVAIDLTRQALAALDDDPQDLARKLLHLQAYGDPLGRHVFGEEDTLSRIGRNQVVDHWRRFVSSNRMQVSIAGAIDRDRIVEVLEREFSGFSGGGDGGSAGDGRKSFELKFGSSSSHYPKSLEQEQIAICFPGAAVTDEDFPIQRVVIGILAGGMSSRLFTEVREKQGLVYWVSAWRDQPRGWGLIHLGASTTPQNVDKTYATLLGEVDRLSDDVTEAEVERAISGIVTRYQTRGDVTRSRAAELADDLFYHGGLRSREEELSKIKSVRVSDVRAFLAAHPRDRLSVLTVGQGERVCGL